MSVKPEVVKVLRDMNPSKGSFVHQDGRKFTQAEKDLVMGATAEDLEEAARQEAAEAATLQKDAEIHRAAVRLLESTPDAATLDEVTERRGTDWRDLLAEESGLPVEEIRAFVVRNDTRVIKESFARVGSLR